MVSSSDSLPWATSRSATAPLNALLTLAIRQWSPSRIRAPVRRFATPRRKTSRRPSRCTTETIPGGPPGIRTNAESARPRRASALDAEALAEAAVPPSAPQAASAAMTATRMRLPGATASGA